MQELLLELQPHIISSEVTLISALAGWLGIKVKAFLDTKEKREIVEATVMYVEQVGRSLGSHEKLELAKEKALEWINTKGFKVSEIELEILIEAAVQNFYAHSKNKADPQLSEIDLSAEERHFIEEGGFYE